MLFFKGMKQKTEQIKKYLCSTFICEPVHNKFQHEELVSNKFFFLVYHNIYLNDFILS